MSVKDILFEDGYMTIIKEHGPATCRVPISEFLARVVQISPDVNLSAADIIGMYETPVKVLDAVVGKIIIVDYYDFILTIGDTNFTAGDTVRLQYGDTAHGLGEPIAAIYASEVNDDYGVGPGVSVRSRTASSLSGIALARVKELGIYLSNANRAFATGNGTLTVRVRYRLIDAP